EVLGGLLERDVGAVQAAHLSGLEGDALAADDGGVAGLAGLVAPAAALGILGLDDEVQRLLGRVLQRWVGGQPIGLTDGDGGQAVLVHAGAAEAAVLGLVADEPIEGALDGLDVLVVGGATGGL